MAGCAGAPGDPASASPASGLERFGSTLDGPVPPALLQLPLVDSSGRHTTLAAMRGKVLVISDIMTLCQETCAIGTAAMLQAAHRLTAEGRADDVLFLSITIDPGRDDLAHLAAYRRQFGTPPHWRVLTGTRTAVDELWNRLGVWRHRTRVAKPYPRDWLTGQPLTSDITHTDDLVFVDAHQRFRFLIDGAGSVSSTRTIPPRIYAFMDRLGHQNVRRPAAGSWTAGQVLAVLHWLTA